MKVKKKSGFRQSKSRKVFLTVNGVLLTLVALICILPFLNLLAISLSDRLAVTANKVAFWPIGFTTSSYEFIMKQAAFLRSISISLLRVALGVSINLFLIIFTAYPLSRSQKDFRLRNIFSWYFVIIILFNGGLIPMYMMVFYTGIIDTIWSLVLPVALPVFSMLVVMNYMRSLPKEMYEASYIDGANHLQTLFRVILPVCAPTIATVTLFSFVWHWNSWFDGMIYMNTIEKYPLQSYLQTAVLNPEAFFRNTTNISADLALYMKLVNAKTSSAAQLFLATIPILCIYPFLQRYFAKGLILGSVKG